MSWMLLWLPGSGPFVLYAPAYANDICMSTFESNSESDISKAQALHKGQEGTNVQFTFANKTT